MQKKDSKKKNTKHDAMIKKIKKMYENYGINTSDMGEDEFDRLCKKYLKKENSLQDDLKASEQYSDVYDDDIIG